MLNSNEKINKER